MNNSLILSLALGLALIVTVNNTSLNVHKRGD